MNAAKQPPGDALQPLAEIDTAAEREMRKIESAARGGMLTNAGLSAGFVAAGFGAPLLKDWMAISAHDVSSAVEQLAEAVKTGDLTEIEKMLIGQAVGLQTMYATLAAKAASLPTGGTNMATIAGLALRAQAQSRATLDSLINLKFPRTTVIAKQANVAGVGGMQQVNNGVPSQAGAHESTPQNELLMNEGPYVLDAGTPRAASRRNQKMETVGVVHRATNKRGARRVVP